MLKTLTHDRNIWTLHEREGIQHHPSLPLLLAQTTWGGYLG